LGEDDESSSSNITVEPAIRFNVELVNSGTDSMAVIDEEKDEAATATGS